MLRNPPPRNTAGVDKSRNQRGLGALETGHRGDRETASVRLAYLPGLDGLRALAVIAVLLYHAQLSWFPGGFLGVEVFFVISGYLITALLLAERRQRGRIDLKAFWLRRARRLLPAVYLLLVVTLAFAVVFLPEEVAGLRNDAIASFGYVTNWYLVLGDKSYFETVGRPSLLQHLWSLAVEEQFYLLWPPLLVTAFWGARTMLGRHRQVLVVVLAGAAASTLLMTALYQPDVDPSRIYYGTDTRAAGLLVGAALAFVLMPGRVATRAGTNSSAAGGDRPPDARRRGRFRRRWGWTGALLLDVVGLVALGGLIWFCIVLDQSQQLLYRGGFAAVALTTAVLIAVVVHPRARLGAGLLGRQPLRWIGLRSYGIYLWHWPVYMVTRPQLDVPIDGLPLLALRLAATVVLADLSYRYVETPIRKGALGRSWKTLREAQGARRRRLRARWAAAVGTGVACCVALVLAVAFAQPPAPPSYLAVESVNTSASDETVEKDTEASATASEITGFEEEKAPATAPAGAPKPRVTAIGDSVMVGAAAELQRAIGDNLDIDAEVGRQAPAVVDILQKRRAAGQLGEVVVIHIGSNGNLNDEQFDEMMQALAGVRRVLFVNEKVPRPWEQSNNAVLANGVRRYPNTVLVDWHAVSVARPEFFVEDGHHLQIEGQRAYADLIAANLEAPYTPTGTGRS